MIDADSTVATRVARALVDVDRALRSGPSGLAVAVVTTGLKVMRHDDESDENE